MRQSLAEWINQRAGIQQRSYTEALLPLNSENQFEHYIDRVKQLLDIAKQQTTELSSERKKRQRVERELADVRNLLKESEHSRRQNRRTLRRASRELNSFRRRSELPAVIELRQQLDQIQQQYVDAFAEEQTSRARAEANLETAEEKLQALQESRTEKDVSVRPSINARVTEERDRRRKAEKESKNLRRKLRHTSRSLNTLRRDHSKCGRLPYAASSNGEASKHDFIGAVFPNLTLARNGDARLIQARDTKQVFDDLVRLNDNPQIMRGERVGSAEPWLEIRPTLTDRIYYRQAKGRGQYIVLIGDKNSQENDFAWMRRNN